jgi:signal peptidase II
VIGGAIGNVIDRIRFGAVADFIDVRRLLYFPWIFNIADSAITVGICLLLVDMLRQDGKERAKRAPQDAS